MKIEICVHEDLENIVSAEWIYEHRYELEEYFFVDDYTIALERDDMRNLYCSYLDDDGYFTEGRFILLKTIEE